MNLWKVRLVVRNFWKPILLTALLIAFVVGFIWICVALASQITPENIGHIIKRIREASQ
jgi:hypothetical protein